MTERMTALLGSSQWPVPKEHPQVQVKEAETVARARRCPATNHTFIINNNNNKEQTTPQHTNMLEASRRRLFRPALPLVPLLLSVGAIHLYVASWSRVHALPLSPSVASASGNQSLSINELAYELEHCGGSPPLANFDPSSHRTVLDAIKAHANLHRVSLVYDPPHSPFRLSLVHCSPQ